MQAKARAKPGGAPRARGGHRAWPPHLLVQAEWPCHDCGPQRKQPIDAVRFCVGLAVLSNQGVRCMHWMAELRGGWLGCQLDFPLIGV